MSWLPILGIPRPISLPPVVETSKESEKSEKSEKSKESKASPNGIRWCEYSGEKPISASTISVGGRTLSCIYNKDGKRIELRCFDFVRNKKQLCELMGIYHPKIKLSDKDISAMWDLIKKMNT
jgi:hypothetical protein